MRTAWTGCGTALVTPFSRSGHLDEAAVRRLVRRQIDAGVHFLVPCGTTGESPTLSSAERLRVIELVGAEAAGALPILAGAGGYDTAEVVRFIAEVERVGATRPVVSGAVLQQADAGRLIPTFSGRSPRARRFRSCSTTCRAEPAATLTFRRSPAWPDIPNIVGVKEASGTHAADL